MPYWLNQKDIDRQKWDDLVKRTKAVSVYVQSFYLDACSEDWEAYIGPDFSYAIPIGVVRKGGISRVYSPLFIGYLEPLGNIAEIDWPDFETSLKERFPIGVYCFKNQSLLNINNEEYVYQTLTKEDFKLSSQAQRKLKQFDKTSYLIRQESVSTEDLSKLIAARLSEKLSVFKSQDVHFFYQLIEAAEKSENLVKWGLFEKETLVGGLLGIKTQQQLLYFKGATLSKPQNEGGMYALMMTFLEYGFKQDLHINFGGSRVEGVRFFYQRFNGKDAIYYHYHWGKMPLWWKIGKWLKDTFKKKL